MSANAFHEKAITWNEVEKYIARLLEEIQARFDQLRKWKPRFAFVVNPFNDMYSVMAVLFANRVSQTGLL